MILVFFILFLGWYKVEYSMQPVEPYSFNSSDLQERILIATQGSRFKDTIVAGVIEDLLTPQRHISVIDVSELEVVNPDQWTAILVIHTWENWAPQADAAAFIERVDDLDKVAVVATSGDGRNQIEGVDGLSAASILTEAQEHRAAIVDRLKMILGEASGNWAH